MTVAPQPENEPQTPNQPSQTGRVIRLTTTNIILGVLVIIGLTMSIIAIYFSAQNPPPAATNNSEQDSKMYELGMQWAQGYVEALQINNPDQNVLNSLYGACVLYTDRRVIPQYGQQLAPSWLRGCLAYTQQQQNSTSPTPTT